MNSPTLLGSTVRLLCSWRLFLCSAAGMLVAVIITRFLSDAVWVWTVTVVVVLASLVLGWRWHRSADFT